MRGGFLRFRFGKEKDTQAKIARALSDFEKWLGQQSGGAQASKPERTEPKTAAAESVPKVPKMSEPQVTTTIPGQPQPKDFGVTPEQVAAYRPPAPGGFMPLGWTLLNFGVCVIVILTFTPLGALPHWLKSLAILLLVAAWTWGLIVSFTLAGYVLRGIIWLFDPRSAWLPSGVRRGVEAYLRAKAEYEKALKQAELECRRRHKDHWLNLSGRDFETEMARLYRADGYVVETTPVTGDEGADLLLRKDGELVIVQCKRQDKPVGPHIVRDLHGTMHHFRAKRAFLDATGGFTEGVRQYVHGKPIELHDLNYILSLQERLSPTPRPPEPLERRRK